MPPHRPGAQDATVLAGRNSPARAHPFDSRFRRVLTRPQLLQQAFLSRLEDPLQLGFALRLQRRNLLSQLGNLLREPALNLLDLLLLGVVQLELRVEAG